MEPLDKMKPNTYQTVFADRVGNLEDLQILIEKVLMICNQHPSMVSVDADIKMEREALSDGSVVYNVHIS